MNHFLFINYHLPRQARCSCLHNYKVNFSELAKEEQDAWSETMLEHSYTWEEWMEARLTLLTLLQKDSKEAKEQAIRSYLACCAEAMAGISPPAPLASSVEEFYKLYGMEESERSKSA